MADLDPLIRLRRYAVEEKQKLLADLFREAEALEGRKASLRSQMERERSLAEEKDELDTYSAYILFAERVRREISDIEDSLDILDTKIATAQEAMREAFADMKKAEIIQRTRKEEERAAAERKESSVLDDIGLEGFRRKEEEE